MGICVNFSARLYTKNGENRRERKKRPSILLPNALNKRSLDGCVLSKGVKGCKKGVTLERTCVINIGLMASV